MIQIHMSTGAYTRICGSITSQVLQPSSLYFQIREYLEHVGQALSIHHEFVKSLVYLTFLLSIRALVGCVCVCVGGGAFPA